MPRLIPAINLGETELTLIIEEDFTDNLAVKLKSGEIDIAILANPFDQSGISSDLLYKEPFMVALPKGHALSKKKKLNPEDLNDDTMLLLKAGNCFREQVVKLCPSCIGPLDEELQIQKSLESSSIETIRQMVAAGVGITILPALSCNGHSGLESMLEFRPFNKPVPYREVILAYRKSFPRMQAVNYIRETVAACKPDLPNVM